MILSLFFFLGKIIIALKEMCSICSRVRDFSRRKIPVMCLDVIALYILGPATNIETHILS